MKRLLFVMAMIMMMSATLTTGISFSEQKARGRTYEITITNLTRGQIFSPPVVMSHNGDFKLFDLGKPARSELAALAEDGITGQLTDYLDTLSSVFDHAVAEGAIPPGESRTLQITARGGARYISAAGMLVTTNDGFFAVRGVRVPSRGEVAVEAHAYDAGSETNSEDCDFIPGPPCGNGGVRDPDDAEGYVHIHAGIHGIADLMPDRDDWRNPVAEIRIRPIR